MKILKLIFLGQKLKIKTNGIIDFEIKKLKHVKFIKLSYLLNLIYKQLLVQLVPSMIIIEKFNSCEVKWYKVVYL